MLLYSTEVWGVLLKKNNPTDSVHLFACKRFLNAAARDQTKWCMASLVGTSFVTSEQSTTGSAC